MRHQAYRQDSGQAGQSAFAMALCLLGVMALAQLVVAGMALAVRFKESGSGRIVQREIIREVQVGVPMSMGIDKTDQSGIGSQSQMAIRPLHYPELNHQPPLNPSPLTEPEVADPEVARLLNQAREAKVASDMCKAIVKLEEALHQSPSEPGVLYELGLVHEEMGIFDKAAAYYEEVFRMGMARSGALYPLAAAKLRDGFSQATDMLGKLSLGRVQIFKNSQYQDGQQAILTIPVQKAPDREVEMDAIEVEVRFFNRSTRGEITELQDSMWVTSQWVSLPWDWAGGSEQLRMTYTIPKQDIATEHLFGELTYYGQVVTLSYKGEVLDVQAWPRDLAARITRQPEDGFGDLPVPEFQDSLPPGFDPNLPLLPTLPE